MPAPEDPSGEADRPSPQPDRGPGRSPRVYSIVIGIAFLIVVAIATIDLRSDDGGVIGLSDAGRGTPLSEFAVPDARSNLEGDANLAQDDCASSERPCPEDDRQVPACSVEEEGAIRVCDLFNRPLVLSFWFTRGGDCEAQQDVFDAVARRYGQRVNFLGINVRDSGDQVRDLIEERGWTHTIGVDRDGALSNLYRVGGCPTLLFAYPGGILHGATIGEVDLEDLSNRVDELLAASAKRAGGRADGEAVR